MEPVLTIPHDVLMEMLRIFSGLVGLASGGLVALRFWFRNQHRLEAAKAKWTNAAVDRFEAAIVRLEGDAKDHRAVTNQNTIVCEGLKGRLEVIQPQVDRLMEMMPPLMEVLGKVDFHFQKRVQTSAVKDLNADTVRVEERKTKGEKS